MRTHPDIGLMSKITNLQQTCCNVRVFGCVCELCSHSTPLCTNIPSKKLKPVCFLGSCQFKTTSADKLKDI